MPSQMYMYIYSTVAIASGITNVIILLLAHVTIRPHCHSAIGYLLNIPLYPCACESFSTSMKNTENSSEIFLIQLASRNE